jgi:hypothetical protein
VSGLSVVDDGNVPEMDGTARLSGVHGQPADGVRTVAGADTSGAGEHASMGWQMGAATVAGMATL